MNTLIGRKLGRGISALFLSFSVVLILVLLWPKSSANAVSSRVGDDTAFLSHTAQAGRKTGSPVGPPLKVILCHKGRSTMSVNENATPSHLRHGDYLGPCQNSVVICHRNKTTLIVPQSEVQRHLNHGDSLGPCNGAQVMCTPNGFTIIVPANQVAAHLAKGDTLGPCTNGGGSGPD
jgi:hypothetical protein